MHLINIEPYEKLGYRHLIRLTGGSVETAVYTPVDEIKTVDAIPVVRCKDCKHRPIDDRPPEDDDYTCPFICWDSYYTKDPDDDFFCKNGERKDGDSDAN